tara:strand:+ start:27333 stop:27569 length:237 start_codon:yes stop_codon:yes gene_type:complete
VTASDFLLHPFQSTVRARWCLLDLTRIEQEAIDGQRDPLLSEWRYTPKISQQALVFNFKQAASSVSRLGLSHWYKLDN